MEKILNDLGELYEIKKFLNDSDVDDAVDIIVKCIKKPDVPAAKASLNIVKLEALSARFGLLATYYMTIGKDGRDEIQKKNLYFTLKEVTARLADALKYSARFHHGS